MPKYKLPPLNDFKQFELFICDLFNELENTNSYCNTDYQTYGVSGQNQKGIDVFSPKNKTVIQCKVKDSEKGVVYTRNLLLADLDKDLYNAFQLGFKFDRYILASTFRDDTHIQEKATKITSDISGMATISYWGWDTIMTYAEKYPALLEKYFPQFFHKNTKTKKATAELPQGALGKDLAKKNYIAYLKEKYKNYKEIQFKAEGRGEKFNYAMFNKEIINRYKAAGINFIPVDCFDDLVKFLEAKIDRTIIGKRNKAAGYKNYSAFGEPLKGVL